MTLPVNQILHGDALAVLRTLPDESVHCCVTSPPYFGLRDYGIDGQIGLEQTPEEYVNKLVEVFREVRRVLRHDGTLWLNLGDSYAGAGPSGASYQSATTKRRAELKQDGSFRISKTLEQRGLTYDQKKPIAPPGYKKKDLLGIPWLVAFTLRDDGWYLRSDIIWHKPNPMPESVKDRPTKAHEYIFLLSKSERYYYDADAIREPYESIPSTQRTRDKYGEGYHADYAKGYRFSPGERDYYAKGGRNKRTVWTVSTKPFKGAHFATFPPDLIEPCILAGCPESGIVLDPFFGAGTTGLVALQHGRNYIGIELNTEYIEIARQRLDGVQRKVL
jgi:DNA modification methylase